MLRSQANSETRIEQTNQQLNRLTEGLDELRGQMGAYADTQREFMRVMTMYMESASARQARLEQAQGRAEESEKRIHESLAASQKRAEESQARINESLRTSIGELAANTEKSIGELAGKQSKTEEALARLADAQAQSERSLDRLTKIVEEERGR
ncbi:MAG TPA: hypothetical protein VM936_10575 [Pyrinomonadaceae bacterium]|nr:hypothetical protein [Pyrinomonadaceae bacterium]